jgi:hypothetical protein
VNYECHSKGFFVVKTSTQTQTAFIEVKAVFFLALPFITWESSQMNLTMVANRFPYAIHIRLGLLLIDPLK